MMMMTTTQTRASLRARLIRGVNWKILGSGIAVSAFLVLTDVAWSFGSRAPVLSAIVTDLTMLVLVAGAVDSVLRYRENARVGEVARVMYRVLAQLALDGDRWLRAVVSGTDLASRGIPQWTLLHTNQVRDLHQYVWPNGLAPPPEAVADRLDALLRCHAFVSLLYLDVSVYKRRLHDVVGQWAPVLLASGASASDLSKIRELADRLGDLHQAIYHGAATTVSADQWCAPEPWLRSTHAVFLAYLDDAEQVRRFYHLLAEENRRIGELELDSGIAVTGQTPFYQTAAMKDGGSL